ncbi:MAG: DUF1330 domain-containing protein [Thermoplasmata archaeon]|nr:MAG: DUF1330 domain-containing protein [Thermoplasmata archaeon]
MAAYMIANVEINDAEQIKEYMKATPEVVKKYSGRFLVRGGEFWVAEGDWIPSRLVILEFASYEKAKEFWHSEEYRPLKALRQCSAKTDMIFVDGISPKMSDTLNL